MLWIDWPDKVLRTLRKGVVIPASPLALDERRGFDARRQRALARYYMDAGSGGIAIGVHTTQFEIRDVSLFEPVLETVAREMDSWSDKPLLRIAGLVGKTEQARREAHIARAMGYHAGLLNLAAYRGASEDDIIDHCCAVASEFPLIGFYMQTAVGGIVLSAGFWRRFAEIENVVAIKMAPFNRYQTLDVMRGVVDAEAEDRISMYTGNDDHIVMDLVTPFTFARRGEMVTMRIVGGLLGHWSVWTKSAVQLLARCQTAAGSGSIDNNLLALDSQVTDCNAALFDVVNGFAGCISGVHEVLRAQGLLAGTWCLNPDETLSDGQQAELDRVRAIYPHLIDDDFVAENLERWLATD
ncbi:MAG: dihydrodipicolinate synthase family protein [Paracoccaceae bacterium]